MEQIVLLMSSNQLTNAPISVIQQFQLLHQYYMENKFVLKSQQEHAIGLQQLAVQTLT